MDNDENKLKKRFAELSLRAVEQRRTVSSDFLTLDEQSTLASAQLFSRVYLYGGYPLAERRAALFGEKSEEEKAAECDFVWVKISPVAKKFADELTHRDFLGTLMGLGIKRETIGDILTDDNCGYVFCEKKVARFVLDNLDRVKHTTVRCEMTLSPPEPCRRSGRLRCRLCGLTRWLPRFINYRAASRSGFLCKSLYL